MTTATATATKPTISCRTVTSLPHRPPRFESRVALVIPAYNEAEHLEALLTRCMAVGPAAIVVIDDASSDGTGQLLDNLVARDETSTLHALKNESNLGKQGSVRRGLRWLAKRGPRVDAVALIDGDGQHDPDELPPLAALLADADSGGACDVVIGARSQREMPLHRRFSNGLVNVGYAVIGGVDFVDVQSGLRLYAWPQALRLAEHLPAKGRYGIEHESLALLTRQAQARGETLRVVAATISCAYGEATSSMRTQDMIALAYHTVRQALRVRRARRPLRDLERLAA